MARLVWSFRICGVCLCLCLLMVAILTFFPLEESNNGCLSSKFSSSSPLSLFVSNPPLSPDDHFMCILVPFRDRFEELNGFVPHLSVFLKKQNIAHAIFVINQVDTLRFNRASLINAGFLSTSQELARFGGLQDCDYVALHDVDLVPLNDALSYAYPQKGPFHVAAPGLHPKYDYATFLGGILLISRAHYKLVNGMSNRYWGWGLEDDEFHRRLLDADLEVKRPHNVSSGKANTFKHFHSPRGRKRDMVKCYDQHEITRRRDRETGLDTLKYSVVRVHQNCVDRVPYTLINVVLECDHKKTPWCDCKDSLVQNNKKTYKRDSDVIVPLIRRKKKP